MTFNDDQFEVLKCKVEESYKQMETIKCPYLSSNVHFNSKGIEHLKFKGKNQARSRDDQYMRLRLLSLAPKVISLSRTVQGISEQRVFERIRSNGRTEEKLVLAVYHEFIAIIDNHRVRVVIKQVGDGPHYFWSIIPFWKNNATHGKRMHYGNPEFD